MINTSEHKNEDIVKSGVVDYPIGFPFYFNPDRTPQLLVKIGDEELRFNHNFKLSEDKGSVVLMPTEEESWTLEGPEDFSWMAKWDGKDLLIERVVPFVQDSDYQLGRISSEQIERDFDLSVMRDQALDGKIKKLRNDMDDEFAAVDSRFDFVQEQMDNEFSDVRDEFAEANKGLSDKIDETKAGLQSGIDDKLPLSGGTLTGPLTIKVDESGGAALTLKNEGGVSYRFAVLENGIHMPFSLHSIQDIKPGGSGAYDLGNWLNKWKTVHTTGLSNKIGEFIAVPEKSGTMALLEDLKDIDIDGYVKKSGDTMTGDLGFVKDNRRSKIIQNTDGSLDVKYYLDDREMSTLHLYSNNISMTYSDTNPKSPVALGNLYEPWDCVYTKKISVGANGADIAIPTEGGTLARMEDLSDLRAGIATKAEKDSVYTKEQVDAKVSSVYKVKGSIANYDSLPTDANVGDVYNVLDTGVNYVWTTDGWDALGGAVDLTDYAKKDDLSGYLPSSGGDVTGHITFSGGWASTRALRFDPLGGGNNSSMVSLGCSILHTLTLSLGGDNGTVRFGEYGGLSATQLTLGDSTYPWKLAYIEKLNNGADLIVPTEGGTLARVEDITAAVGDISTALAAILGE